MHFVRSSRKILLALFVAAAIAGCTSKIDASSGESLQTSVQKMRDSLPEMERAQFLADIKEVSPSVAVLFLGAVNSKAGAQLNAQVVKDLDGLTLEQIRAKAAAVRTEALANKRRIWLPVVRDKIKKDEESLALVEGDIAKFANTKVVGYRAIRSEAGAPARLEIEIDNRSGEVWTGVIFKVAVKGLTGQPTWSTVRYRESVPNGFRTKLDVSLTEDGYGNKQTELLSQIADGKEFDAVEVEMLSSRNGMVTRRDESEAATLRKSLEESRKELGMLEGSAG